MYDDDEVRDERAKVKHRNKKTSTHKKLHKKLKANQQQTKSPPTSYQKMPPVPQKRHEENDDEDALSEYMHDIDTQPEVPENLAEYHTVSGLSSSNNELQESNLVEPLEDEDYILQLDLIPERSEKEAIYQDTRIDRKIYKMRHTIIISRNGSVYQLISRLDEDESEALYQQTGLYREGKVVLGEGAFGKVRIVLNNGGEFLAVKKMQNPAVFAEECRAQTLLREHGISVLPVIDTITVNNSKGVPTIYQIMPIANVGSGQDLLNHWNEFKSKEQMLMLRHFANTFISEFVALDRLNIFHRDFKPDNFLLDLADNVPQTYLADCGAVVQFDQDKQHIFTVSDRLSVPYFSPEFLNSLKLEVEGLNTHYEIYRTMEAWRLGLTLLQFAHQDLAREYTELARVMKEMPYQDKLKQYAKLNKVLKKQLQRHHVPKDLRKIIVGLLEPDWSNRLTIREAQKLLSSQKIDEVALTNAYRKMIDIRSRAELPDNSAVPREYFGSQAMQPSRKGKEKEKQKEREEVSMLSEGKGKEKEKSSDFLPLSYSDIHEVTRKKKHVVSSKIKGAMGLFHKGHRLSTKGEKEAPKGESKDKIIRHKKKRKDSL